MIAATKVVVAAIRRHRSTTDQISSKVDSQKSKAEASKYFFKKKIGKNLDI